MSEPPLTIFIHFPYVPNSHLFKVLHHLAVLLIQPCSSSYIGEVSIFIFTASAGSNQATHIDFAWLRPVSCNEFISPKFQKL